VRTLWSVGAAAAQVGCIIAVYLECRAVGLQSDTGEWFSYRIRCAYVVEIRHDSAAKNSSKVQRRTALWTLD